jgi:hypothetical protein
MPASFSRNCGRRAITVVSTSSRLEHTETHSESNRTISCISDLPGPGALLLIADDGLADVKSRRGDRAVSAPPIAKKSPAVLGEG